ncbi:MAG TPA: pilin [Candidatus Saccharimonadales bacterium]|nr:pilin [Candidatus Saccharimonadales bacterium]
MTPLFHLFNTLGDATAQVNCGSGQTCDTGLPGVSASSTNLQGALEIVFGIIGAIAVLMIVLAGLRFVLAQGSPQETAKARNTIIYAVIGLVISIAAEAFVAMVLGKL